ncbi:MAG: CehA/McbA family metallohydrolase [Chloroflexota bacterium]
MKIRIDGTLDYQQNKQHIAHAFSVPEGTTRLTIHFDYSPKVSEGQAQDNALSLTLFDPERSRGARHNNRERDLTITAYSATPGYTPGALQAGIWMVWIDTHRVMPPDTIHYFFEIELSSEPVEAVEVWKKGSTAPRGAGWYRGDLHGHTFHSDGRWDVPDLIQYARDYRLDFVTLSDHNTVSGLAQLDSFRSDDLLTIGGMELTTYYGHALALGVREWIEWRVGVDALTMPELADRARQAGATFIIAHPMSVGDPFCTGCDWGYPDMMPGNGRIVEVWNSEWGGDRQNELSLQLWYRWLNQGYRMVGTRGSDLHRPMEDANAGFDIVFAPELTEYAILEAIRAGHLYLSSRPRLAVVAQGSDNASGMMGDFVPGEAVEVRVGWSEIGAGDHLRLIVDGKRVEEFAIAEQGEHVWTLTTDQAHWCVIEIRAENGELHAVTNPIFMGSAADWR